MNYRNLLFLLVFFLLAQPALFAVSLHVSDAIGSDSTGDGSAANPFRSITRGLAQAKPGDNVVIAPGTYDWRSGEVFPLNVATGVSLIGVAGPRGVMIITGNPWMPVIKVGAGNDSMTKFENFSVLGGWVSIQLEFSGGGKLAAHVELDGVALEGGGGAISLFNSASPVAGSLALDLHNCQLAGHWGAGIDLWHSTGTVNVSLRNTVIQNCGSNGLSFRHGNNAVAAVNLLHCTVARNSGRGIFSSIPGISFKATNSIIHGNSQGDWAGVDQSGISYCLVTGGSVVGKRGNVSGNPCFIDEVDWHLGHGSAALGMGDETISSIPQTDLDGQERLLTRAPDAGADQQIVNTFIQDQRGLRIYRKFTLRTWTMPKAAVAILISFDTLSPGVPLPPLQGLLQLDYTKALEVAGVGYANSAGVFDFLSTGFSVNSLLGTAVAFQGVAFYTQNHYQEGFFTNSVKTWFLRP